jgi:hypothetical protein
VIEWDYSLVYMVQSIIHDRSSLAVETTIQAAVYPVKTSAGCHFEACSTYYTPFQQDFSLGIMHLATLPFLDVEFRPPPAVFELDAQCRRHQPRCGGTKEVTYCGAFMRREDDQPSRFRTQLPEKREQL